MKAHGPAALFFAGSLVVMFLVPAIRGTPSVYSGDEPHYLIVVASLLNDGDLSLANNYERRVDAGRAFHRRVLDRHALVRDTRTGESVLWDQLYDMNRPIAGGGFVRKGARSPDYPGPHFVETPKHPLPFPLVLAGLVKLTGAAPEQIETRAIYSGILLAWLAGILTYGCALKAGLSMRAALFAVALLYFCSPWLVYSRQLFPAAFMGLLLIGSYWAFLGSRLGLSAALIAIAALQSEAFILILPAWTAAIYFKGEKRKALTFAIAGGVCMIALLLTSHVLMGKASTRTMEFGLRIWRTFVEANVGVWLFVPWTLVAMAFLVRHPENRVLALGIVPVAAVYMILPYTGQYCYGPRYWVPFLPWLAIVLVLGWKDLRREARWGVAGVAAVSFVIAVTAAVVPPASTWGRPPWRAIGLLF